MRPNTVVTWKEFEKLALVKIREVQERPRGRWYPSKVLFRGQSDANWRLKSTLERCMRATRALSEYYELMRMVRDRFASRRWDLDESLMLTPPLSLKGVPFMVYLRQNGFPSPLLDWTSSPYIAAFFAFRNVQRESTRPKHVSIFTFQEFPDENVSFNEVDEPWVQHIGWSILTDKKHYLQQCQYTICLHRERDDWLFDSYDRLCDDHSSEGVFQQYDISFSEEEQQNVLRDLRRRRITAFDLFESEEGRMKSLAVDEPFPEGGRNVTL